MKKYAPWIISYAFFILANICDFLSSLGQFEKNPLMQVSPFYPMFDPWKAVKVKALFLIYYATLSIWAYCLTAPLSRRLAIWVAAIIPIETTYILFQVAFRNLL